MGIDGLQTNIITDPLVIDGGKVEFTFKDTNGRPVCNFLLTNVKQVKGKGTADADKLTTLSTPHKTLLKLLINDGEESYTAKDMKDLLAMHFTRINESYDPNHYNRTISELLRKRCFDLEGTKYFLNVEIIEDCLRTGNF